MCWYGAEDVRVERVPGLAAARVPRGKVVGIDTWTQKSRIGGNRKGDPESVIARRNADLEGVKVEWQDKGGKWHAH